MKTRTRFAPSPTGRLHLGHVFAAKVARDLAKAGDGGEFMLRHEDIDGSRVREEYYDGIEQDLKWLGLAWDGKPLRQSTRFAAYDAALSSLRERGLVYPCFCTRREIQELAAPHGPGISNYPGTCRKLTASEQLDRMDRPHAWRLDSTKATNFPLSFRDLRFGEVRVNPDLLGDVVLARKDIGTAYHLAVVIDDAYQEISHVTRGEDLLESTHVHRLLQFLLDLPEPVYLHHRLVSDERGKRLAKRDDSHSVAALRVAGWSPEDILKAAESSARRRS